MRILIAEDDAISRLILQKCITRLGHDCLVAQDGNEAWAMCAQHPVDVVISDWMMPGLDGPELCRRIRSHAESFEGYMYVILLTSLEGKQHLMDGLQAGADDYLVKPLNMNELQARLISAERVTSLHRSLREKSDALEQLNHQLYMEGRTDALTRLRNRLSMQEDLDRLHDQSRRYGYSFGAALIDIDFYKRYNDYYGHMAGDEALKQIARTLESACRTSDTVYRYGGEEFLVLLPEQSLDRASEVVERLRRAVRALRVPHEKNPAGVLTISAGVTGLTPETPKKVDTLLKEADLALYYAKENGRDSVAVFSGGICMVPSS